MKLSGFNTKQWIWNGSIAYQFLAGRKASIMVSVYDILGQKKSVNRNVTASYIEDAITNTLGRYGLLTFTYRFTTFKAGEQPKDRNEDFGPGGRRFGGGPGGRGGGGASRCVSAYPTPGRRMRRPYICPVGHW